MLSIELYLLLTAAACMLIAICSWGGSCFSITSDHVSGQRAVGTGWGYYIFSFILVIAETGFIWLIRERAGEAESADELDGGSTRGERTALRSSEQAAPSLPAVSSVSQPVVGASDGFEPIPSAV